MHFDLAHPEVETHVATLCPYLQISRLRQRIRQMKQDCEICQQYSTPKPQYGEVHGHLGTDSPFAEISSDIYGPLDAFRFEEGRAVNKVYLLTISDRCTRWTEVFLLKSISAQALIPCFTKWFQSHGLPRTCLTDQRRQYISETFRNFLAQHHTRHVLATTYNPTGNSISERIIQTITRVLQTAPMASMKEVLTRVNWVLQNQFN